MARDKKNKARRSTGVQRRVAEREIAAEPGMYGAPIHLAKAGSKVHEYIVGARDDKPDPLGLTRNVRDILRTEGTGDNEVDQMLLDMEREGLIEALPDGKMLVKGTKEQLLAYGIDPTDKSMFEGTTDAPEWRKWRKANHNQIDHYMTGYSKHGENGDPDVVLCHNPEGGNPMLFPRAVLAKAQAGGEHWVPYTEAEMKEWQAREGDKAKVSFVLDYNPDAKDGIITNQADLDEAWHRANSEVTAVEARLGSLEQKAAYAASNLLAATEDADTPGWTHDEIKTHLGVNEQRIDRIIQDMLKAGHLEVHTRANGEKAYRLNEAGKQAAVANLPGGEFDEDDPRLMSRQWFHDLNTNRAYR